VYIVPMLLKSKLLSTGLIIVMVFVIVR